MGSIPPLVPPDIVDPTTPWTTLSLPFLWLHENQLASLPEQISSLTDLMSCIVENNPFTCAPEMIDDDWVFPAGLPLCTQTTTKVSIAATESVSNGENPSLPVTASSVRGTVSEESSYSPSTVISMPETSTEKMIMTEEEEDLNIGLIIGGVGGGVSLACVGEG